ncbi:hypothetical protein Mgra_00001898 [Meloidogyne graminicola]|uniref:Uncharacterized protein n=1 Tax=Meloidogyne graminicola TaxID=189291 RepID=A0A8S9ZXQ0_9BILA|nr:hypothetical protein Mgra_00001898 [Meloidogyne graminicola]
MGLDMVKSHSSFGSIGVPSVIDKLDLQLFCNLDLDHDKCLIRCGFQVQFNMREFVCNSKREELISHLNCYSNSSLNLKKNCGSLRCGPYNELKLTFNGMGQRCRTILCDLNCIQKILNKEPNCRENGKPAIEYLIKYSQLQVFYWLKEIFNGNKIITNWQKWPRTCSKLICENIRINEQKNVKNCILPKEINY